MSQPPDPVSRPPAPPLARSRLVVVAAAAAAVVLFAAGAVFWLRPSPPAAVTDPGVMRVADGASIGGPFRLTDQSGRAVTEADFAGRYMLVYFGFTHCPDVCPTELQTMGNAMDVLGADGEHVVPIFITVDPERDTPEQLKGYVAAFHPKMVGLTGSLADITAAAKAYKVYFRKAPDAAGDDYQVDHSSFVYLVGPDGKLRSMFRASTSAKAMAAEIRSQLRQSS